MDFQSLSRKELQVLCKKNKIPANMTNVAMADALAALPNVEGTEEIGNTQSVLLSPQTCKGTSKRPIKQADTTTENEPNSSVTVTRTRRGAQKILSQDVEKENNDNPPRSILKTPATRATRRRPAGATSVCKNSEGDKEDEKDGKDEEKAVRTRGHTTRRSTRLVSEKKGKSITDAFEMSDENDKGTSKNDKDNTEEIFSAQTEKSTVGLQVTDRVVSVAEVPVMDSAKNSGGEEFVANRDNGVLGDFSVDDDQALPHNDVNQVLDNSCLDVDQVDDDQALPHNVVDPKMDEADVSKSDVNEVVVPVAEDITKTDVNEVAVLGDFSVDEALPHNDVNQVLDNSCVDADQVLSFVVDPKLDEADISKSDVSEVVVPVAEDITKTDVNEVLVVVDDASNVNAKDVSEVVVPVAEDITKTDVNEVLVVVDDASNVNANEVLISVDNASKPFADQCVIPTKDEVSVEDGSNADEVCNNPVDYTDQVLIHFTNENQPEDENSGDGLSEQLTISEKTESLHRENQEFQEPLSTVEIQMDNLGSAADPVEKPDSSLQVQAEIEILGNQNPSEMMNESSEITAMVIPFSSSTTSTPSQVPTTPKLAASDSKRLTSQTKKATPIPKMALKVFEEDTEVVIAVEEKDKQISNSMKVVEDKENNSKGEDTVQKSLKKKSLRQLRKLFKDKLATVDNNGKENIQMEKMRPALHILTDNCIVGNEEN